MPRKKKVRGAEFKARVALAAVQGDKTAQQAREAELFEQIGRLNMELDWLKKKVAGLG